MTLASFLSHDQRMMFAPMGEPEEKLSDSVKYVGQVKLPIGYDPNSIKTPIQRQIELSVTNGRGYESFGEALAVANDRLRGRGLNISIDSALEYMPVVSYEDEVKAGYEFNGNPCSEVYTSEPVECTLPDIREEMTLVQKMMHGAITEKAISALKEARKKNPRAMVDVFPDYSIVFPELYNAISMHKRYSSPLIGPSYKPKFLKI